VRDIGVDLLKKAMMFSQFLSCYESVMTGSRGDPWLPQTTLPPGYQEFMSQYAGVSVMGGMFRVHNASSGRQAQVWVDEGFSEFDGKAFPFAFDWLGRQYALDRNRSVDGEPQVLLIEPGSGEALEIPATFREFLNVELVEDPDAVAALSFFLEWKEQNPRSIPLSDDVCVGYKVPLFLGGSDDVANLELSDIDVYWSLSVQLRRPLRNIRPGEGIESVRGD